MNRHGLCLFALLMLAPLGALAATDANKGTESRLAGHVLAALANATPLAPGSLAKNGAAVSEGNPLLGMTFVLRRDDEAGFQQYLHDVQDPASPIFRKFLTQAEIAERFGPSQEAYDEVLAYLRGEHFELSESSANRLTISVRAARADAERAFAINIADYAIGTREFYANDRDPALPGAIAMRVQAITGLSNLAQPSPLTQSVPPGCGGGSAGGNPNDPSDAACDTRPCAFGNDGGLLYKIFCVWTNWGRYDPPPIGGSQMASGSSSLMGGAGQTVGLVEFDTFHQSDVVDFIGLMGLPADEIDHVTQVHVNGGATLGAGESEVLLDIMTILTIAPAADVVVYDAPLSTSFQAVFNAMIDDGVSVIGNSWAYCENQTTLADVQSIDSILQGAAASGISVFNGAGDTGSTCLDGAPATVAVPADVPSATAVGGTTPTDDAGVTYSGESWWNGSSHVPTTGQGGFGSSLFFVKPAYQNAVNFSQRRSVPDVVSNSDPATGVMICQADAGGCPTNLFYGGTSFSAPSWAGFAALLNQAQGTNIGNFNVAVYPFANTSAFHNAASMGSDFAHVGLGSPNLDQLYLALTGQTAGPPSASASQVHAGTLLPSYIATPAFAISADGTSIAPVTVRLRDANGHSIGGKTVTLSSGSATAMITPAQAVTSTDNGAAVFNVTDLVAENVTLSAADVTDGITIAQTASVAFVTPSATAGSIVAFTDAVAADGVSTDTITVTLVDGLGRPTPGKLVNLAQTGNSVISGPSPSVTGSNGQIAFTVTDTVQETITYTATDVSDGNLPVPGSALVTFNASGGDNCGITHTGNPDVSAGPGYAITPFAIGFVPLDTNFGGLTDGCRGASGLAFDASGNLYVSDLHSGNIYRFGTAGGAVGPATLITPTPLGPGIEALAFGHDGKLYGAQNATTGNFFTGAVIEINPVTGALVRTVASSITCASFLATDPASGDLFVNDSCAGGGSENGSVWRIANPGSATPTTTIYTSTPGVNGGMSFSAGGTLYMLSYRDNGGAGAAVAISGTDSATPGQVSVLPGITGPYLAILALGAQPNGDAQSVALTASPGTDGFPPGIRAYDITGDSAATTSLLMNNGFANVHIAGPDGCQYVSMSVAVYKITNADGSCPLDVISPLITLSPSTISPDPAQGTAQTLTATFHNVDIGAGTAVLFEVGGANAQVKRTTADADGVAILTYSGVNAGTDTIVASALVNGTTLTSNPARINWSQGAHTTFISLNASPSGSYTGIPVTLVANLVDISAEPTTPVSGGSIGFTIDGQTCNGVTDGNGIATCSLTVPAAGVFTLTATYAGTASFLPATISEVFTTTTLSDVIFADGFDGL